MRGFWHSTMSPPQSAWSRIQGSRMKVWVTLQGSKVRRPLDGCRSVFTCTPRLIRSPLPPVQPLSPPAYWQQPRPCSGRVGRHHCAYLRTPSCRGPPALGSAASIALRSPYIAGPVASARPDPSDCPLISLASPPPWFTLPTMACPPLYTCAWARSVETLLAKPHAAMLFRVLTLTPDRIAP
jgi:hypothetical protein